jgi:uncharacterized membrane protein
VKRRHQIVVGLVLLVVGVVIFGPFGGDGDCNGAPCESGFLWRIWVAVGIVVVWFVAAIWLLVSVIRAQRRDDDSPE